MTDGSRNTWNPSTWQRHRAVRTVAHHATDAADLAELLAMLGLTAIEGRTPPEDEPVPQPRRKATPLEDDSAERLTALLREALPSARGRAG